MLRLALIVLCLGFAGTAAAENCRMPATPDVPDGASASDAEMSAAHEAVAEFVVAGNAYVVCLTKLRDAAPANTPTEQIAAWTKQHNDAVDAMNDVADRFNAQLRIWKAKP